MNTNSPALQTPVEILEAALEKEKDAYRFYDDLLNSTTVLIVQELLEHLRDEERKHMLMIEKKIAKFRSDT